MGRKHQNPPKILHSAEALDTSFDSIESNVQPFDKLAYMVTYSGLVGTGTFKVQGGMLDPRDAGNVKRWADLDVDPVAIDSAVAAADSFMYNIGSSIGFERIRLVYTAGTASAGTCEIMVNLNTQGA